MAWEHLDINRPHLVYIILGGFTSLFMLCSSVIKERLYIGEATVATLCGIIFGPHAANLINPLEWGNTDQITLEFARIVLVVQCFAVGVELPKSYMEKHWKSVTLLLVPVMTWGWLITSLTLWWMFGHKLNWLDSLCVAACVTATDPVLASSVVGKGKFAKRVPKHLRDLLSAESGCNDGMAFPFIYLALYLIRYRPNAAEISLHWFCYTILYECIFGAFYGVMIGYIARRAIRYAHERDLIDRESFLVFYFVLALFCAGSGSMLGMDDLLIGFACGVGFSNDGWFQEKTEESHVSNVIDLLINLAFFVYFGTIIPWQQFNSDILGISPWRLVVLGLMVLFFRRIPIMLALKPVIPDIKTWREALFAGHFGPIGVGALFVAILARAELENHSTTPLAVIPEPGFEHLNIIEMIWPITTFLVIVSIVVHGSSIAVFTLGKHINTLTLTLSYTQGIDDGPSWMDRLPRIQSRSKSSMSLRRPDDTESSADEKMEEGIIGLPANFLRRQRDEDSGSRTSSLKPFKRKKWDTGIGPGGPISQSAIGPVGRPADQSDYPSQIQTDSETLAMNSDDSPDEGIEKRHRISEPEEEVYQEGDKQIIEDEEGNVLEVRDSKGESKKESERKLKQDGKKLMKEKDIQHGVAQTEHAQHPHDGIGLPPGLKSAAEHPGSAWRDMRRRMEGFGGLRKREEAPPSAPAKKHGPALAYQFGNTIIVEDQDGEVIKKYDIPAPQKPQRPGVGDRKASFLDHATRGGLHRMGTWMGMAPQPDVEAGPSDPEQGRYPRAEEDEDDARIRFVSAGGRRMSKAEFIQQIQSMDPKARARMVEDSDAPEALKQEARADAEARAAGSSPADPRRAAGEETGAAVRQVTSRDDRTAGPEGLTLIDSNEQDIPFHPVSDHLAHFSFGQGGQETAAQRRRRLASGGQDLTSTIEEEEEAPRGRRDPSPTANPLQRTGTSYLEEGETAAERRRRLAALGDQDDDSASSSDEEETGTGFREPRARNAPRRPSPVHQRQPQASSVQQHERQASSPSIRFADSGPPRDSGNGHHQRQSSSGMRLRWGADVGQKPSASSESSGKK